MIPGAAVEAAAKWLHDNDCRSAAHSGFPADFECYDWMDEARELLEAAAPHITGPAIAYLDESARMISSDPEVTDYERGFDDAIRGMSAKVKRLLNGESQ